MEGSQSENDIFKLYLEVFKSIRAASKFLIFGKVTRYWSCMIGFMIKNGIMDPYEEEGLKQIKSKNFQLNQMSQALEDLKNQASDLLNLCKNIVTKPYFENDFRFKVMTEQDKQDFAKIWEKLVQIQKLIEKEPFSIKIQSFYKFTQINEFKNQQDNFESEYKELWDQNQKQQQNSSLDEYYKNFTNDLIFLFIRKTQSSAQKIQEIDDLKYKDDLTKYIGQIFRMTRSVFGVDFQKNNNFVNYFKNQVQLDSKDLNRFFQLQIPDLKFWQDLESVENISSQTKKSNLDLIVIIRDAKSNFVQRQKFEISSHGLQRVNGVEYKAQQQTESFGRVSGGRKNQTIKNQIEFAEAENSISRKQFRIEYDALLNHYNLFCTSTGAVQTQIEVTNSTPIKLDKNCVFVLDDLVSFKVLELKPNFSTAETVTQQKQQELTQQYFDISSEKTYNPDAMDQSQGEGDYLNEGRIVGLDEPTKPVSLDLQEPYSEIKQPAEQYQICIQVIILKKDTFTVQHQNIFYKHGDEIKIQDKQKVFIGSHLSENPEAQQYEKIHVNHKDNFLTKNNYCWIEFNQNTKIWELYTQTIVSEKNDNFIIEKQANVYYNLKLNSNKELAYLPSHPQKIKHNDIIKVNTNKFLCRIKE